MKKQEEQPIGVVIHYYGKIGVAVIKALKRLSKGDTVRFRGSDEFDQRIDSIQIDHREEPFIPAGREGAVKTEKKVREGDEVYEII